MWNDEAVLAHKLLALAQKYPTWIYVFCQYDYADRMRDVGLTSQHAHYYSPNADSDDVINVNCVHPDFAKNHSVWYIKKM